MTEWISVKDKLPNDGDVVMIQYRTPYELLITTAVYHAFRQVLFWSIISPNSMLGSGEVVHDYITHWMPLPKPPEDTHD